MAPLSPRFRGFQLLPRLVDPLDNARLEDQVLAALDAEKSVELAVPDSWVQAAAYFFLAPQPDGLGSHVWVAPSHPVPWLFGLLVLSGSFHLTH